ncbi:MAG: hypothetical protein M1817_000905 [Caeruleum heppii]|nr:MAG: hypothetical protein M1817_000905 [Caeruleum heppii]
MASPVAIIIPILLSAIVLIIAGMLLVVAYTNPRALVPRSAWPVRDPEKSAADANPTQPEAPPPEGEQAAEADGGGPGAGEEAKDIGDGGELTPPAAEGSGGEGEKAGDEDGKKG